MTDRESDGPAGRTALRAARSVPSQLTRSAARRKRRCTSWLLVAALAAASLAVTIMFLAALGSAVARHDWAMALDSARDAVPALVGWAGLAITLFCPGGPAEPVHAADADEIAARTAEIARHEDCVRRATERVDRLAARLAALNAGLGTAGPGTGHHQSRERAETAARLEQARQWLASAQDALASRQAELALSEAPQPHAHSLRRAALAAGGSYSSWPPEAAESTAMRRISSAASAAARAVMALVWASFRSPSPRHVDATAMS